MGPEQPATPAPAEARVRAFAARLVAAVAVSTLLVLALVALIAGKLRTEREERARVAAQNLARLLEHDLASTLEKIDVTLLAVVDEAEAELRSGGLEAGRLEAFLAVHHARTPEADNLLVADAEGTLVHGASLPREKVRVADRDYFRAFRDGGTTGLFISKPVLGRLTERWVVIVARRIGCPDGSFGGVATAVLPIAHFARRFASVDIGTSGGISLRDAGMGIIARHPAPRDVGSIIGNRVLSPELRAPFEAGLPEATFFTPRSWDNTAKVVAYRKVGRYPLYVNVGIATSDYLAGWGEEVARFLALAALYVVVTAILSWALFTRYRREQRAEASLHRLNAELEDRVAERTSELNVKNAELESALTRVKQLEGIIPICMYCKQIRDDDDSWQQVEKYISEHSEAMFSHGICPTCLKKVDPGST